MVTEQRADELLGALREHRSHVRRIWVLHILIGILLLSGGIALLMAPGYTPFESSGTSVWTAILLLSALTLLGAFSYFAVQAVQLGDRMRYGRQTEIIIEGILGDDPQLQSGFNRDIIMTIYEHCLLG